MPAPQLRETRTPSARRIAAIGGAVLPAFRSTPIGQNCIRPAMSLRFRKRLGLAAYELARGQHSDVCVQRILFQGSGLMQKRMWGSVALFGLVLLISEVSLSGDEKKTDGDKKKEVEFPELPKGAGKIDKDAPKTFTDTKSGLKYRILRKGEGKPPKVTDSVKVNYQGWLDNGKVFDSSYKKKPISFPLNGVIKGWTEGMQLVSQGGMIELEIPSDLGYGARGFPPDIPPKATLHFIVELLEVQ
jgi:FKBP-type peptidyl-prolyl cis-trans isomerase FkpA